MAYLGNISLRATNADIASIEAPLPIPEALDLAETLMLLKTSFRTGGFIDQPWLVTQMMSAALEAKSLFIGAQSNLARQ
jgi:hypothetical protein